jgi:hypothetical protein
VRDKGAVTGYTTKLAGLAGATGAEIEKITQAPLEARRAYALGVYLCIRGGELKSSKHSRGVTSR